MTLEQQIKAIKRQMAYSKAGADYLETAIGTLHQMIAELERQLEAFKDEKLLEIIRLQREQYALELAAYHFVVLSVIQTK